MGAATQNLSSGQLGLWLHNQRRPHGSEYNLPVEIRLGHPFDVIVLETTLRELVRRHAMLRTTYHLADDQVVQVIHDKIDFALERVIASSDGDAEFKQRVNEEARRPFNLERGPVIRAHLFSRSTTEELLLLNFHHIVSDGFSLRWLLEEFGELYLARLDGRSPPETELGGAYTDFVAWQERLLTSEKGERYWQYWREQLGGERAILGLPHDKERPIQPTHPAGHVSFPIAPATMQRLRRLAASQQVAPAVILLALYAVLLRLHSGDDELTIFLPRLGRPETRWDRTFGYFINLITLRETISGGLTFAQLVQRMRSSLREHRRHEHYPLPELMKRLKLPQLQNQNPLAQAVFNFIPENVSRLAFEPCRVRIGGLKAEIRLSETDTWIDLDLRVLSGSESTHCYFIYDAELWEHATIERMGRHYCALLDAAIAEPDAAIESYSVLSEAERDEILLTWNETESDRSMMPLLHQLIEQQADLNPMAAAVSYRSQLMSYGELDRQANKLAHHLISLGVGPERVVGVCLDRSPDLIISFLAILKAGGVYLPLDPRYPDERLEFMLHDTKAIGLVTHRRVALRSGDSTERSSGRFNGVAQVIDLEEDAHEIAMAPKERPGLEVAPQSLAYIIYTSGSTGSPKGVMVEHRSLRNMAADVLERYEQGPGDRVLQFATAGFDASLFDFVLALTAGAALCLVPPEAALPGAALADFMRRERISTAGLTPSVWALTPSEDVPHLRTLKSGGEPLTSEIAARWAPGRRLFNSYGPTEAAVYTIRTEVRPDGTKPMIGRPAINTKVYILDKDLRPVPVGVPGELYIGGENLARGYVNRPELTASSFIASPFAPGSTAKLYKTGDRARYREGGVIEYLGRTDSQVKIRGMRVELGEVEAVLARHPAVASCCAVLREDRVGDKRLVAYATLKGQKHIAEDDLRSFMRRHVPEHLVPMHVECLPKLPLTHNGKVDVRALPVPQSRRAAARGPMPETRLEREIAEVWKEVLGINRVELNDNFFDIGGHSLAVVQVQARLKVKLDLHCEIVAFFEHPTVKSLSQHLSGAPADGSMKPDASEAGARAERRETRDSSHDIAIIGMSGRFPGATDTSQFWANLCEGLEGIADLSDGELERAGVDAERLKERDYVKREGILADIELFDAKFFGYSPKDAAWMDPQQRLLLEASWHALEQAGYTNAERRPRSVGVFAGVGTSNYLSTRNLEQLTLSSDRLHRRLLNSRDFTATRIAYKLNLRGPCVSVQTACSTSLVAVHLACQSLRTGESDLALAGGASIAIPHGCGYVYQDGHILSPDGRCRAFDADAQGTVKSSGAAVVVLKRLAEALEDKDHIWAVIKGSAINNDGSHKVGFTAPSAEGQAAAIAAALDRARIDPQSIGYIETHGTGTFLGDPIEFSGLLKAFGEPGSGKRRCALGSVKTNVGHLDTAAGAAGLIKAALALHHETIPPTLHFHRFNPNLKVEGSGFYVNRALQSWRRSDQPRRAGVSSFGIGGTNAHVVLEEAPQRGKGASGTSAQLLTLSARTATSLARFARELARHIRNEPQQTLEQIAYTLQTGRAEFAHRVAVACRDSDQAIAALEGVADTTARMREAVQDEREFVFMFSGQGAQRIGMGRHLYRDQEAFRAAVDRCAEELLGLTEVDFRPLLFSDGSDDSDGAVKLQRLMQPVIFAIEYALAELLQKWGIKPAAVIGHSVGEYAAAHAAGVISLKGALRLTLARGQIVRRLPPGAVLVVAAPPEELKPYLGANLSVAAINAPSQCVISGTEDAVSGLHERLQSVPVQCRRIAATHAVHSFMLDPLLSEFETRTFGVSLQAPRLPVVSTVTGTWATEDMASPIYWVRNLRQPVNFACGMAELLKQPNRVFIEVGPGSALANLVKFNAKPGAALPLALATMPLKDDGMDDGTAVLDALGALWSSGLAIDWSRLWGQDKPARVPLPGYCFDRERHWIEEGARREGVRAVAAMSDEDPSIGDAALAAAARDAARPGAATGTGALAQRICDIFGEVLGLAQVKARDRFFDLGGDSLSALGIMSKIEQISGKTLPLAAIVERQTPEALARLIEDSGGSSPPDLLVPIQTEGSRPPLFCPHPIGGHAMAYIALASALGRDQPLYGIQARGLDARAALHTSIQDMAADYIDVIKQVQRKGPYHLAGWSMGGSIAWEMAWQLQAQREPVAFVGLLDAKADHQPDQGRGLDHPRWLSEDAVTLSLLFPDLRAHWGRLNRDDPLSHAARLLEVGARERVVPAIAHDQLSHLTAVLDANRAALEAYRPRPLRCRVVLFTPENGLRSSFADEGADLGWRQYGGEALEVVAVPGDHYSSMKPPHVNVLAVALSARLPSGYIDQKRIAE